jgi:hypothetical protein
MDQFINQKSTQNQYHKIINLMLLFPKKIYPIYNPIKYIILY